MTKYVVGDGMVKEYRLKKKLTQEQLAELLNISTRQLQRIEKMVTNTTLETWRKLKNILEIPDEEMIKILNFDKEKDSVKM